MEQENVYVYIGRYQIFHNGHEATAIRALEHCDHLIMIVGSYETARDPKNPFLFNEIKTVIEDSLDATISEYRSNGINKKLSIVPVHDYLYSNTKWLTEVQEAVSSVTTSKNITITGYSKDESSFYLKFFPQWKTDLVQTHIGGISSTPLRQTFFEGGDIDGLLVPSASIDFLNNFRINQRDIYQSIKDEHDFIPEYQQPFLSMPYPLPFLTGDAVVTCAGHILLIERKHLPGKGLWALPGGFFTDKDKNGNTVDYDQVDTAIRELREETRLKVPEPVLRGCIREKDDFSHPQRSLRWRIITKAVFIVLNDITLPAVKGSDDAKNAFWIPINDVKKNRARFFEDHIHILDSFLGIL